MCIYLFTIDTLSGSEISKHVAYCPVYKPRATTASCFKARQKIKQQSVMITFFSLFSHENQN